MLQSKKSPAIKGVTLALLFSLLFTTDLSNETAARLQISSEGKPLPAGPSFEV